MISVSEALDALFSLVTPLDIEEVALTECLGRVMARPASARRAQPPFAASAMDGYAISTAQTGDVLQVIGESAAGHRFQAEVGPGEAVRIFTGAPVPKGVRRIVIQEDVTRESDAITLTKPLESNDYIRPAGNDFAAGATLEAPKQLTPNDVALLASMNVARVPVYRRPVVALMATGDELVMPGDPASEDQIMASNTFGLHALLTSIGALPRLMPIARDTEASLRAVFDLAKSADLVITVGGASVGDHDLVAPVAAELGMKQAFHKVAMRPGKPLMSGKLGNQMMIGLPGNPVSAMVCGHIFVLPVVRAMMGLGCSATPRKQAVLTSDLGANGPREHYMRAQLGPEGISAFARQDSSLLSILGKANALIVRAPGDAPRQIGDVVDYVPI